MGGFQRALMLSKEFWIGASVTFAVWYSIPISAEQRATSKYYNPDAAHKDH
eukprot:m.68287 g.68287  ORF g.68287 m.68287 type:complete len:51 (+) comp15982_c0_seq1:34-186(+)